MDVKYDWPITYSVLQGIKREYYVAHVPHCASKAIERHQIINYHDPKDIIALPHRIAPIGDPIKRFKTSFNFFHNLIYLLGEQGYPIECACDNYNDFVDYTFENYDRHWAPQSSLFDDIAEEGRPTHFIRLDQIGPIMTYLRGKPLAWVNMSGDTGIDKHPCGHSDYRINDLREKFEADYELLDRALGIDAVKEIF